MSTLSTQLLPYLTHSRLLPIQLTDPALRTIMLTQFWIVANHLMSQVPQLRAQLQTHLDTAQSLLASSSPSTLRLLQSSAVLERSEPQWRLWKKNKCQPDLEAVQTSTAEFGGGASAAAAGTSRKRTRSVAVVVASDSNTDHDEEKAYEWLSGQDLQTVSQQMRASAPSSTDHLADYVEALDPDSGIEAEYHPKNDAVFTWRALRLLSESNLEDFGAMMHPSGDFEGMVRSIYRGNGVDIPGEGPAPYEAEDEEEEEEEEEEAVAVAVEEPNKEDVEMTDSGVHENGVGAAEAMDAEHEHDTKDKGGKEEAGKKDDDGHNGHDDDDDDDDDDKNKRDEDGILDQTERAPAEPSKESTQSEENGEKAKVVLPKAEEKRSGSSGGKSRSPSQQDGVRSQPHRNESSGGGRGGGYPHGRSGNGPQLQQQRPHDRRDYRPEDRRHDGRGRPDDRGRGDYRDSGGRGGAGRGPPPPRDYERRRDEPRRDRHGGGGGRRR